MIRWGSWLKATLYYSENLPAVKEIVNRFEDDGKLVKNAKEAINSETLANDLVNVHSKYHYLFKLIEKCEFREY